MADQEARSRRAARARLRRPTARSTADLPDRLGDRPEAGQDGRTLRIQVRNRGSRDRPMLGVDEGPGRVRHQQEDEERDPGPA